MVTLKASNLVFFSVVAIALSGCSHESATNLSSTTFGMDGVSVEVQDNLTLRIKTVSSGVVDARLCNVDFQHAESVVVKSLLTSFFAEGQEIWATHYFYDENGLSVVDLWAGDSWLNQEVISRGYGEYQEEAGRNLSKHARIGLKLNLMKKR